MKKLATVMFCCLLGFTFVAFGEVKEADQKWLTVVEKMISEGERKISTPDEGRVNLLKKWGDEKGYTVKVTKTDKGHSIEVTAKTTAKVAARN